MAVWFIETCGENPWFIFEKTLKNFGDDAWQKEAVQVFRVEAHAFTVTPAQMFEVISFSLTTSYLFGV